MSGKFFRGLIPIAVSLLIAPSVNAKSPHIAYDIDMAKEICAELPLESVEGVWVYPDDKVTVLILNDQSKAGSSLSSYNISVVETSDARLHPGEVIGKLYETAQDGVFEIELSTERKNDLLLKPKSCLATLSKDGESFLIKRQKSALKGRLNLNFNRLLPGFWKIVSTGVSLNPNGGNSVAAPIGMVKIYPSYDGNGSSKRKVRYL